MLTKIIYGIRNIFNELCHSYQWIINYTTGDNDMARIPSIIESLCYILTKLKKADKIYLVKLMYLADKYHLMQYGRTVTGDNFIALGNGPAGSKTMDVLEFDRRVLGKYVGYAKELFTKGDGFEYFPGQGCSSDQLEWLSETDIEALDFTINNFGKMGQWDVVNYTHELPEWEKYESLLKSGKSKQEQIRTDEVLSITKDKYFSVSEDHMAESHKILTGTFD